MGGLLGVVTLGIFVLVLVWLKFKIQSNINKFVYSTSRKLGVDSSPEQILFVVRILLYSGLIAFILLISIILAS
jgi:hypothetical protein